MEPRNCRCVTDGILLSHGCTPRHPGCCCNGTGKVWASVEAEQVRVVRANGIVGVSLTVTTSFDVPFDGEYRIICQPVGSAR